MVAADGAERSPEAAAPESGSSNGVQLSVVLDAGEQSGSADANVRIHASRDIVWSLITSCPEALILVPGLVGCDVLQTAADGSWQRIRHVVDYSWYVPRLTYEIRAVYDKPSRVTMERTAGDLKTLQVSWSLRPDGGDTIARYEIELVPGFWVPRFLVRLALRRDLPKMLIALRTRAEAMEHP